MYDVRATSLPTFLSTVKASFGSAAHIVFTIHLRSSEGQAAYEAWLLSASSEPSVCPFFFCEGNDAMKTRKALEWMHEDGGLKMC
jgi:hypothetical protein